MKRPLWFRGGILIGLLAVPLVLYQADGPNATVALLVTFGLLAVATVWSEK
ncbi:MAG TPA: hypothetical protein VJ482_06815 [Acidimicrobiia bacterium]|jgi:hypothetical protein|nr:hypothetical protein [Acidimicrobiia bacterium]